MGACDLSSLLGALEFEAGVCETPHVVEVRPGIFIVAYQGPDSDGWLATFTVNDQGVISSVQDTFEFDGAYGGNPSICLVATGIIAVAFRDNSGYGIVETYAVDASANINNTLLSTYMFNDSDTNHCCILKTGIGDIYTIAFVLSNDTGYVKTITINSSGIITQEVHDGLLFDAGNGNYPVIKRLYTSNPGSPGWAKYPLPWYPPAPGGQIFVIFFVGPSYDVKLCTISIDEAGLISNTPHDTHVFSREDNNRLDFVSIPYNMVACVYSTTELAGRLRTIGIANDGQIDGDITDFYDFPDANFLYPHITMQGPECYTIAYQGPDNHGWIKSIIITALGDVAADVTSAGEFDDTNCEFPSITRDQNNLSIVVYKGTDDAGIAKTAGVQPAEIGAGHHEMIMGAGP